MELLDKLQNLLEQTSDKNRIQALAKLESLGFPADRSEDWKYTKPSQLLQRMLRLKPKCEEFPSIEGLSDYRVLQINNGKFESYGKSLPVFCSLRRDLDLEGSCCWTALNLALVPEILEIKLKRGEQVSEKLQLILQASNEAISNFNINIEAAENSHIKILITLKGGSAAFVNLVISGQLAANSQVDCVLVQENEASAYVVCTTNVGLAGNANFKISSYNLGAEINRNNLSVLIDGENSDAQLFGLSLLNQTQHVDNHTMIDHAKPHSTSTEIYKGVYADKSCGVFDGTIIVRQDAQKTNAVQSNQATLLSDTATSNAKPQLKIWADDVKCTHGATVGQIDAESLFYLQARGISRELAKGMLINAFAAEVVEQISETNLKEYLLNAIDQKLKTCC